MFAGATVINRGFKINTFRSLCGILQQALEHVRFNWIRRFPVPEFNRTDQSIFKVWMVSFNIKGDITERE